MDEKKKPGRKPHTAVYTETIIAMVDKATRKDIEELTESTYPRKSISEIARVALEQFIAREKRKGAK